MYNVGLELTKYVFFRRKKMKCCCISGCIAILLVIILVCVALFVLTPETLGIADAPIMGEQSLRDLGLENMTLFEVIKELINLMSPPNEEEFTGHTEENLTDAQTKLSLPTDDEGEVDYSTVLENGLNNTTEDVQLSDKETAAVLNDIIKKSGSLFRKPSNQGSGSSNSGSGSGSEPSGTLPSGSVSGSEDDSNSDESTEDMFEAISENISLSDLEIAQNSDGDSTMKITIGVAIKELINEMGGGEDALPPEVANLIHDGKTFITQEFVVDSEDGQLKLKEGQEFSDMLINGQKSTVIMSILSSAAPEGEGDMLTELQTSMGDAIMGLFNQLGADSIIHGEDGTGYINFKPVL